MFWVLYTCLALMVRAGTVSHGPWACSTVQVFIGYKVQGSPTMCWKQHRAFPACAERSLPVALGSSAFHKTLHCAQETLEWPGHLFLCLAPSLYFRGPLQQHFWTTSQCCKDPIPSDLSFSWISLKELFWPPQPSPANDPTPEAKTVARWGRAPTLSHPWVQTLAPSLTCTEISDKLLDCSRPQFVHMSNEGQTGTSSCCETL